MQKYDNRPVHISIDDVDNCMKDATMNAISYKSIFQQPFFRYLYELHNKYGVKFTLYIYAESDKYSIEKFPVKFRKELQQNSDWLKFGFHSIRPKFAETTMANTDSFEIAYMRVTDAITRFAGNDGMSKCLRLHYFYASKEEVGFLADKGITTMLAADDPERASYSLPIEAQKELHRGSYSDSIMHFLATDMRIEKQSISPYWDLYKHIENDTLVIFTHEWALDRKSIKFKFGRTLQILYNSGANFVN